MFEDSGEYQEIAPIDGAMIDGKAAASVLEGMAAREAENRVDAAARWWFAKTFIEPYISEAANDEQAKSLLPNHEYLIASPSKAQLIVKARKMAHSWANAVNALCTAATKPRSTTIIGSYDEEEAKEKNNFLEWIYKAVVDHHPALLRELKMTDGQERRKFANGSRIRFIARKAPTGAGATIEIDEFSVERPGGATPIEILVAAFGATTHQGHVRLGGTERGPLTMFHKIRTGKLGEEFKDKPFFAKVLATLWEIGEFPWWTCPALCTDVVTAELEAPTMDTEARVEKFGNEALIFQYGLYVSAPDSGLPMFQREFECETLDDTESYLPYSLIQTCYPENNDDYYFDWEPNIDGAKYGSGRYGDILAGAKARVDALARLIDRGLLTGTWGIAMDIGRHHDQDEIMIGHEPRELKDMLCVRLSLGMKDMPFPGKREMFAYCVNNLPINRGYVDGTRGSLGVEMAEWALKEFGQRAQTFVFTNETKTNICANIKGRMQNGLFMIGYDTKFTKWENQAIALKKIVQPGGAVLFDVERNKNQHGDCFFASAMLSDLFGHPNDWKPRRSAMQMRQSAQNLAQIAGARQGRTAGASQAGRRIIVVGGSSHGRYR